MNVPDSPSLNAITAAITVEAWVYATGNQEHYVFARRDPLVSEGFTLSFHGDGWLQVAVGTTTSPEDTGSFFRSNPDQIQVGQWEHIAATANVTTGSVKAYVNGQEVALNNTLGPTTISGSLSRVSELFIGRRQASEGYFAGFIDEVGLYDGELSVAEVQRIFNAGPAGKCKS